MISSVKEKLQAEQADRLRQAREYVGLSIADVASALGMASAYLKQLESGTEALEATLLERLAKLYRRSPEFLATGASATPNGPEQLAFLARAKQGLSDQDIDEVARFAEFLNDKPQPN